MPTSSHPTVLGSLPNHLEAFRIFASAFLKPQIGTFDVTSIQAKLQTLSPEALDALINATLMHEKHTCATYTPLLDTLFKVQRTSLEPDKGSKCFEDGYHLTQCLEALRTKLKCDLSSLSDDDNSSLKMAHTNIMRSAKTHLSTLYAPPIPIPADIKQPHLISLIENACRHGQPQWLSHQKVRDVLCSDDNLLDRCLVIAVVHNHHCVIVALCEINKDLCIDILMQLLVGACEQSGDINILMTVLTIPEIFATIQAQNISLPFLAGKAGHLHLVKFLLEGCTDKDEFRRNILQNPQAIITIGKKNKYNVLEYLFEQSPIALALIQSTLPKVALIIDEKKSKKIPDRLAQYIERMLDRSPTRSETTATSVTTLFLQQPNSRPSSATLRRCLSMPKVDESQEPPPEKKIQPEQWDTMAILEINNDALPR